jgi:MFS transporter, ACS family, aldohexuronate transporter
MSTPATVAALRVGYFRWTICALLFFATTINYIDRQILSLVKEQLDHDLGWSATQFGLVNSAFQGAYGISLLGFGWFIDRYGVKVGYAVSIAAWSLMAMAHALVGSIRGFIVARIGLGLGEGGNYPGAIKSVTLWFPQRERALATSVFNSGANVGAIVAPAIVPLIALNLGWRWAFVFAGIAGLSWLLFWLPLFQLPEHSSHVGSAELDHIRGDDSSTIAAPPIPWGQLLKVRETWSFIVAKFLTDPVWWFFLIWLPDLFRKVYGMDIRNSWDKLAMIYAIITALSIGGGWLTGHLNERGWSITRSRKTGLVIFALCVVPVILVTRVDMWTAVLLIALAGAAHQAWSANLYSTVSDMFPKSAVASVIGIGSMAGAIGGMLFPAYCGWVLDRFKAAGDERGAYTLLLSICAFAYVITFMIHHLLAPRFEPILRQGARR